MVQFLMVMLITLYSYYYYYIETKKTLKTSQMYGSTRCHAVNNMKYYVWRRRQWFVVSKIFNILSLKSK